jgi:predicted dehydrogenase
MKKLRVAIIGSGGVAQFAHLPGWQKLKGVEIAAMSDVNKRTLAQAARKFGVGRTYLDYRKMLEEVRPDAVSVCTWNAAHRDPTVAALKAGAHVLVEKPIAMNAQEAAEMVEAARRSGKLLMVAFNNRFRPEVQYLKREISHGLLGEIYYAEAIYMRRRGIPGWGVFTEMGKSGGGALLDVGVHMLDMTLYLMGHPRPVSAFGASFAKIGTKPRQVFGMGRFSPRKFGVEDFGVGLVRFETGACLLLKASWAANIDNSVNMVLMGDRGGCVLSPFTIYTEKGKALVNVTPVDLPKIDGYSEEVRVFAEAIRKGLPSPIPGEQGLIATAILDAIYRSGETGKEEPVKLTASMGT